MKEIQLLQDLIADEMEDSDKYIDLALENKESWPELAKVFYDLSIAESGHRDMLHTQGVRIIEKYRREHGEPPAAMLAVYDYLHKKEMSKASMIKSKQDMWRQS